MNKDIWMSEVLSRPVYRLTDPEEEIPPGCSLVYAKILSQRVATVSALEERGFRVVDVTVTLSRPPGNAEWAAMVWKRVHNRNNEELLRIASTAFTGSRLHLDPLFPNEDANKVKREWLQSYLDGKRGTGLLVALDDDRPVGFLAVSENNRYRFIDLLATDSHSRRQGVGEALISSFIADGDDRRELRVGTQITNLPSLRLYQRMGFEIISACYVLHLHPC